MLRYSQAVGQYENNAATELYNENTVSVSKPSTVYFLCVH